MTHIATAPRQQVEPQLRRPERGAGNVDELASGNSAMSYSSAGDISCDEVVINRADRDLVT